MADGIAGSARGALRAARIFGVGSPDDTGEVWTGGFDGAPPEANGWTSTMGLDETGYMGLG